MVNLPAIRGMSSFTDMIVMPRNLRMNIFESCWNCALDTLEWLAVRFRTECPHAEISVRNSSGERILSSYSRSAQILYVMGRALCHVEQFTRFTASHLKIFNSVLSNLQRMA